MTYWLINAAFLVTAGVLLALAWRQGPPHLSRSAVLVTGIALLILTAVFDNIMIAVGLMAYADAQISGVMLGLMPVEDFSYTVFAVLALPALWTILGRRRARDTRDETGSGGHAPTSREQAADD